jgi:hydrogenase expression/formation protein HypC
MAEYPWDRPWWLMPNLGLKFRVRRAEMCLAVPMRVKSIKGNEAEVESGGTSYLASIMLTPEVKVGDYVLLHTGYAISVVNTREAEETLAMIRTMQADEAHEL